MFRAKRFARRAAWTALAAAVLTICAEVALAEWMRATHSHGRSIDREVDAALVLGASMDPDGRLSWNSRRRVQAAVELMADGKAGALIFSGSGPGAPFKSVGELMQAHAVELGAPPDRLLVEDKATTTLENLHYGFRIADAQGYRHIALSTDAWHLGRAWALAAWMGRGDVELLAVDHRHWHWRHDVPLLHLREAAAWWVNVARVAAWETKAALGISPVPD